ncbi:MAG: endonuclease/exonuclease/phosphatase family protein, partial [Chloroflexota bacterium]|nr:endonuclease/exonuclease/phosphatase family protein [Chloroflexota bacterium]
MKRVASYIYWMVSWSYSSVIISWFILHQWVGDSIWWLALVNAFTPWLFAPLVGLIPLALIARRRLFYLPLLAPTLFFLLLYGSLFVPVGLRIPAAHASSTPTQRITVLSFNVWAGSRTDEVAEIIKANGLPDLVAIQELTPFLRDKIIESIGKEYPYRTLDPHTRYRGMGIFSRYPLTVLDTGSLATALSTLQKVEVQAGAHRFTFYNVHPHSSNILVYQRYAVPVAAQV